MSNMKFDEADRNKVIAEIETHFGVKLSPVGNRKKYLQDQNKRTFWVFGGYEDWHGIPSEMMEAEEKRNSDGILVIAKRGRFKIVIYTGSLLSLIKSKQTLSHTKKGEYQFNIRERGDILLINEVPKLHLSKLGAAAYSADEKTSDKNMEKVETMIRNMSPEKKNQLLEELLKRENKI